MSLELATFISQLVPSNPVSSDSKSQGDDHLRLVKAALQSTFPNASGPFYKAQTRTVSTDVSFTSADDNSLALVDNTAAQRNLTLPATGTLWAGWRIRIMKAAAVANAVMVFPASGVILGSGSSFDRIRLSVPFEEQEFFWTGGAWLRLGGSTTPAGKIEAFASLPVGFYEMNGQLIEAANNPELAAAWGSPGVNFNLPNMAGCGLMQRDTGPIRVDPTYFGTSPGSVGNIGGAAGVALTEAQLAAHTHANTLSQSNHDHDGSFSGLTGVGYAGGANPAPIQAGGGSYPVDTNPSTANISINNVSVGSGQAHSNMQPTMVAIFATRQC